MSAANAPSLAVYSEMRHNNILCDAVLKVENCTFPVHKVILCGSTEYFRAMFERWNPDDRREFTIGGISAKTMSVILDFIYTDTIDLSETTVQDVVMAADMLLLDKLVTICFDYMQCHLDPDNCIAVWKFSDFVISTKTKYVAWRYILNHFEDVRVSEEFLELTASELISIIEADELNVKSESAVFEAVLAWTNHALEDRRVFFSQMFAKVRLALIPQDYIHTDVLLNSLVVNDSECHNSVAHFIQEGHLDNSLIRPRFPGAVLLAIGGGSGGAPTNAIEAYDYKTNGWLNVTNNQEAPRAYHGTVLFNGSVYCIGGFNVIEYFNSMRRLDLSDHTWHEMPPMYHRRCYVSVTELRGCIYAMGGYNGQTRLSAAEVFKTETNQWSQIAPMNEQRSDASCATLNDKIYICGGYNGVNFLQTAECYDPETDQWSLIAPMITRRSGLSVIAYSNQIYAVGGFDGHSRLRSVEVYNPHTNRWQEVASMLTPRSNFGIGVLNDHIFVVGGFNGASTTNNVEFYNPQLNTWSEAKDMDIMRSALDCCVISGLPNMSDYIVSRDDLQH